MHCDTYPSCCPPHCIRVLCGEGWGETEQRILENGTTNKLEIVKVMHQHPAGGRIEGLAQEKRKGKGRLGSVNLRGWSSRRTKSPTHAPCLPHVPHVSHTCPVSWKDRKVVHCGRWERKVGESRGMTCKLCSFLKDDVEWALV